MTKEQLKEVHRINGLSDIDMLIYLLNICDKEDFDTVEKLIDMNLSLFCKSETKYKESDYFDLKYSVLCKYDTKESWVED